MVCEDAAAGAPAFAFVTLPIVWRPAALRDAEALSAYYAQQGGVALETGFLDELAAVFELLAAHPDSGSPRHASLFPQLPVPLRFHPLRRFSRILVYYLVAPDRVEVVRVWDAARGLGALLDDAPDDEE